MYSATKSHGKSRRVASVDDNRSVVDAEQLALRQPHVISRDRQDFVDVVIPLHDRALAVVKFVVFLFLFLLRI